MFATKEELWLFVDWMFLGVAERVPSGKNPDRAIEGFWFEYDQPDRKRRGKGGRRRGPAYMRGSDLAMRRYVVIRALREHGLSLKEACAEVGIRLGKTTAADLDSIKTGFEKYGHPSRKWWFSNFCHEFTFWMDTEIRTNLIASAVPIETMSAIIQTHAETVFRDRRRAEVFAERWTALALRAIPILEGSDDVEV